MILSPSKFYATEQSNGQEESDRTSWAVFIWPPSGVAIWAIAIAVAVVIGYSGG